MTEINELEARVLYAEALAKLADSGLFPVMETLVIRAEAVSVLNGRPINYYLPTNEYITSKMWH
jgi:hypothetical protein